MGSKRLLGGGGEDDITAAAAFVAFVGGGFDLLYFREERVAIGVGRLSAELKLSTLAAVLVPGGVEDTGGR